MAESSHRHAVAGLRSMTLPGENTIGVPSASSEFGAWHEFTNSVGTTPPAGAANVVVARCGGAAVVAGGAFVGAGGAAVAAGGAAVAAGGADVAGRGAWVAGTDPPWGTSS